jgi:hypothetical protein
MEAVMAPHKMEAVMAPYKELCKDMKKKADQSTASFFMNSSLSLSTMVVRYST